MLAFAPGSMLCGSFPCRESGRHLHARGNLRPAGTSELLIRLTQQERTCAMLRKRRDVRDQGCLTAGTGPHAGQLPHATSS